MPYRIGDHRFDPGTGEVTTGDGTTRLEPQPARVLSLLAEAGGGLVTREELREALWPAAGASFDDGINYCIREIRKAFGERASDAEVVETLPRRGYRLIPEVRYEEAEPPVEAGKATPDGGSGRPPGPNPYATAPGGLPRGARIGLLLAVALLLGVLAVGTLDSGTEPPRVLLLPLTPAPGTPERPELQASLAAALTGTLTGARGCVVPVGPATTGLSRPPGRSDVELGRRHGADLVVSGFHGGAGDSAEVFLQVVRVDDGAHLHAFRVRAGAAAGEALVGEVADSLRGALPSLAEACAGGR